MIGHSALPNMPALLEFAQREQIAMLATLRRLVELESPSDNKAALDAFGEHLRKELEALGADVVFHQQREAGNHLEARFAGSRTGKPVLLLGHFDTVWPLGTLPTMPFREENGRVYGPGVFDMKAGIVFMVFALQALHELQMDHRPVIIFLDTDEEIGSTTSRPLIEGVARECEAVLVLEPAQGVEGKLKTSRKGVGDYTLRVQGRAAHAGVDFEKGHSAIVELSRQILEVAKLVDLARGITVNPGVVQGGTRSNVVAGEAWVEVDVRIASAADSVDLDRRFRSLRPFDQSCTLEVSGGLNRPPMERTAGNVRLFNSARQLAQGLGFALQESSTGGGSDGNFTSALGIPTLDGLGAVGEGAHALNESIVLGELARRTALLAGLLGTI